MEPTPGDPVNVHAAWRLAVAGRPRHAGNAGIAALTVAGSVGAGLAAQFSDLELDCCWTRPPTDPERHAPVEALGGDLAEAHSGASLSEFRATLQEHRRSIGPPPAFR